jgi:hypothetical protein
MSNRRGAVTVPKVHGGFRAAMLLAELYAACCVVGRAERQIIGATILVIARCEFIWIAVSGGPRQAVGMIEADGTVNWMVGATSQQQQKRQADCPRRRCAAGRCQSERCGEWCVHGYLHTGHAGCDGHYARLCRIRIDLDQTNVSAADVREPALAAPSFPSRRARCAMPKGERADGSPPASNSSRTSDSDQARGPQRFRNCACGVRTGSAREADRPDPARSGV